MVVNPAGNIYELSQNAKGQHTFLHKQTGELLHSHIGPYEEAWGLYIENSGLLSHAQEKAVVYDVGLGCASQLIATRDMFFSSTTLKELVVFSFDLETEGIKSLCENIESFPFASQHFEFLKLAQRGGHIVECDEEKIFEWHFVKGDFFETSKCQLEPADYIFYDFFSPASHPKLWTFEVLARLEKNTKEDCLFLTYSTATAIRAALLACGFFVGEGPETAASLRMTAASKNSEKVCRPLDQRWLQRFLRSGLPFSPAENESNKTLIQNRVREHPQFLLR